MKRRVLRLAILVLALSAPAYAHQNINAAIMISAGENYQCQFGNINDAYIVEVTSLDDPDHPRFITSSENAGFSCVILPIAARPGTHITITGVLQDTTAIPSFLIPNRSALAAKGSAYVINPTDPPIVEGCFNVEGFSVGLSVGNDSEYNPLARENRVNDQGYGLLWYDSDSDLKPGPYDYKVISCGSRMRDCPTSADYFNTDPVPFTNLPKCTVLKPIGGGLRCALGRFPNDDERD